MKLSAHQELTNKVLDPVGELMKRQILDRSTSDTLPQMLSRSTMTAYSGFDPTADSLHVGNLVALFSLIHFCRAGHNVLALVGGATGCIGDPSGKSQERPSLLLDQVMSNSEKLSSQISCINERILQHSGRAPVQMGRFEIVNNYDWFKDRLFLDVLRDVGKYMKVSDMVSRDSVKSRISSSSGLSFTEFTYQLLQAYDFLHLAQNRDCRIQVGGSDQWGNIISGIELISRKAPQLQVYGVTTQLLTTRSGEKFGKSAGNAIWLDDRKTSHFDFFQLFMRQDDEEVERLLKYLTFIDVETEIREIMNEHRKDMSKRLAQRELAKRMTLMIHGSQGVANAEVATKVLFGQDLSAVRADDIISAFQNDPRLIDFPASLKAKGHDLKLLEFIVECGICQSKGQVKKLIGNGGLYLNGKRVSDMGQSVNIDCDSIDGKLIIIRTGKANYHLINILQT